MFIAILYTISKTCKKPKCLPAEEWIKKRWYIYTVEYYSAIKTNEIMPFTATWMQTDIIILSKVRQRQISYDITWMWNPIKIIHNNLLVKQKKTQGFWNQT